MIARLRGTIVECSGSTVVVDVQGVGYELACPLPVVRGLVEGKESSFIVFTMMRESEIRLYGFTTALERKLFDFLLQVNGVGPKSALEILSAFEAADLIRILGSGEVGKIQQAKGIGKKTAERIVLELQEKVSRYALEATGLREQVEVSTAPADVRADSILALVSLGFTKAEAEAAVQKAKTDGALVQEAGDLVKAALAYL